MVVMAEVTKLMGYDVVEELLRGHASRKVVGALLSCSKGRGNGCQSDMPA